MKMKDLVAHWRFELLWGTMAVLGCLAMLVVEVLSFRLALGKW
ncbi:MAG TPA: hypothetical protein VNM68_12015 [Candidatus Polarisedimenticolia bacterium]|jgi:hypothetical protein|nr:hypothetical protein [Candidatus Polarisedimenticolia bacterium]